MDKELIYKQKVINFKLSPIMTMPQMVLLHYGRHEVEALFQTLQNDGFGEYIKGARGRNGCAKFIANDKCPETYEISFQQKVLISNKPKTYFSSAPPVNDKVEGQISEVDRIMAIKRKPTRVPQNERSGYVCSVASGYLFVDRVSKCGFNSITDALDDIWNDIKRYVSAKGTKEMTQKEEVESRLMGLHFYKLSK